MKIKVYDENGILLWNHEEFPYTPFIGDSIEIAYTHYIIQSREFRTSEMTLHIFVREQEKY